MIVDVELPCLDISICLFHCVKMSILNGRKTGCNTCMYRMHLSDDEICICAWTENKPLVFNRKGE